MVNPKNTEDNECSKHSITIAVYTPKVHPERVNKKLRENSKNFNWEGIDFPTPLEQFTIFGKNNPDYGINVLAYD